MAALAAACARRPQAGSEHEGRSGRPRRLTRGQAWALQRAERAPMWAGAAPHAHSAGMILPYALAGSTSGVLHSASQLGVGLGNRGREAPRAPSPLRRRWPRRRRRSARPGRAPGPRASQSAGARSWPARSARRSPARARARARSAARARQTAAPTRHACCSGTFNRNRLYPAACKRKLQALPNSSPRVTRFLPRLRTPVRAVCARAQRMPATQRPAAHLRDRLGAGRLHGRRVAGRPAGAAAAARARPRERAAARAVGEAAHHVLLRPPRQLHRQGRSGFAEQGLGSGLAPQRSAACVRSSNRTQLS